MTCLCCYSCVSYMYVNLTTDMSSLTIRVVIVATHFGLLHAAVLGIPGPGT